MTKLCCVAELTTVSPASEVVGWLQRHCEGQWDLLPASIERDGVTKRFMILFENDRDCCVFKSQYNKTALAAA